MLAGIAQGVAAQSADHASLPFAGSNIPEEQSGYHAMVEYAISTAQTKVVTQRRSVVIDPATLTIWPSGKPCTTDRLAVVIDLDPGSRVFDQNDPPLPAEGLARELDRLRSNGISILWATDLHEGKEDAVRMILAATELDPERKDTVIMASSRDTKHGLLLKWTAKVCAIAMGGDRIGDFEPAYDYLRDPNGPIGTALVANVGAGWFLVSPPIS